MRWLFHTAFDGTGAKAGDPEALRTEIDGLNAHIYATVNNGVSQLESERYRSGRTGACVRVERALRNRRSGAGFDSPSGRRSFRAFSAVGVEVCRRGIPTTSDRR
jgi:hypothetical protein